MSCGDELPPLRDYPMRVCAECILRPRDLEDHHAGEGHTSVIEPYPAA
jgi:hypothetical protein